MSSIRRTDYEVYERNRMDYKLAELLNGEHPLEAPHEVKVIQLAELGVLYHAVQQAGWHRHTGDWDWAVFVTVDGKELPGEGYALRFKLPPDLKEEDFTASVEFDKVTHVVIEGYHLWDGDTNDFAPEEDLEVPISSITQVRWEQE